MNRRSVQAPWITPIGRVIPNVRIEVDVAAGEADGSPVDEPADLGIVVSCPVKVEAGLRVVFPGGEGVGLRDLVSLRGCRWDHTHTGDACPFTASPSEREISNQII
jgi:hypothetical protein